DALLEREPLDELIDADRLRLRDFALHAERPGLDSERLRTSNRVTLLDAELVKVVVRRHVFVGSGRLVECISATRCAAEVEPDSAAGAASAAVGSAKTAHEPKKRRTDSDGRRGEESRIAQKFAPPKIKRLRRDLVRRRNRF